MRLTNVQVSRIFDLILTAVLLQLLAFPALAQERKLPRFESSECAIKVPDNIDFNCGNLFVPENRAKKRSREIRLPVIIVKSTSDNPLSDPVIYTAGGPGASSLGRARGARFLSKITAKRDFIIFEQRGTTYAEPALQCPEVVEASQRSARENLKGGVATKRLLAAVRKCRSRLLTEGVDLAAYDSSASAADLEDLRKSLGIGDWNLYGLSYSTRLMLNYVREYPEHVRSIILDSVLPPEVNWDETGVHGVFLALNRLFEACRRSNSCDSAHPRLAERFFKFVSAKQKEPIKMSAKLDGGTYHLTLSGNDIFEFAYELLENTWALPDIPLKLEKVMSGDTGPLQDYVHGRLTGSGFVWGMRYSVWCREEMPFELQVRIRMDSERHRFLDNYRIQGPLPEICRIWGVPAADKVENKPVSSDVPLLVFGGEFDPDTPPKWGKQVADRFPNGHFYEVNGMSHGVLFGNECAWSVMTPAFLDDPSKAPDGSCLPKKGELKFK